MADFLKGLGDMFSSPGILLIMGFILAAVLLMKIGRLNLPSWNGFLDSLDRHGGHIFVGFVLMIVGIAMMKIMLYDDGKYIVGLGGGILSRSMGSHSPIPVDPQKGFDTTFTQKTTMGKPGDAPTQTAEVTTEETEGETK